MTDEAPRSHLHRLLRAGEFVVTAELQTSDSADPARVTELAGTLRGKVDAVNCTDNSAAHAHIAAMAAARLLLDQGVEPVMQLVCRDRNRLALQADLLGAAALGVRNVVCMTGDDVSAGDHPETKPIYDLDSVQLIRTATIMREQNTVDIHLEETTIQGRGRHDPCVLPRAVPMVEAMAALVMADHALRHQAVTEPNPRA